MTIRTASALTGINQNTLRAWERRHGLVSPERTPKGYRLYGPEDLARLREIQHALQQGIPVSQVREHLETQAAVAPSPRGPSISATRALEAAMHAPGGAAPAASPVPASEAPPAPDHFAGQIEQAARRFDRVALERAFGRAVGLHTLRRAFTESLAPALRRMGEQCVERPPDDDDVRFLADFARSRLSAALAGLRPLHQLPRVLCACAPGEQHELGLMLLALEVGLDGVSTQYIGDDRTPQEIADAVADAGCRVVALSSTMELPRPAVLDLRQRLAAQPRRPRLLLGGPGAIADSAWLARQGLAVLPLDHHAAGSQVLEALKQV